MRRRDFLNAAGGIAALGIFPVKGALAEPQGAAPTNRIMTVNGWIDAATLGTTLMHEHALANFQGYESWSRAPIPYDLEAVTGVVVPCMRRLADQGVRTFVDATAAYLGRDPVLLRHLSEKSGLNILTVTGNYAAFDNRFLPPWVHDLTPVELAGRWIHEWQHGIGGTGVRPGFIKLGFNEGKLSAVEQKLIRAAAIAHRKTGSPSARTPGPPFPRSNSSRFWSRKASIRQRGSGSTPRMKRTGGAMPRRRSAAPGSSSTGSTAIPFRSMSSWSAP